MGYKKGGGSGRKVDKDWLVTELLRRVEEIDNDESTTRSVKTKKHERAAQFVKSHLYEDGRKTDDLYDDDGNIIKRGTRLKLGSYGRYLSEVRKAVRDAGLQHHLLAQRVETLKARWPEFKKTLDVVLKSAGYEKKNAMRHLLAEAEKLSKEAGGDKYKVAYQDFSKLRTDHDVCRFLSVMAVDKKALKDKQQRLVKKSMENKYKVNYSWVIRTIGELVNSDGYSKRALGLAMASGRRASEILYHAKFKVIGEYQVQFSGQLKERRGGVDHKTKYDIYTLIPAKVFIKKFNELRQMEPVSNLHEFDNLTESEKNKAINNRTGKTLSEAAKRVFPHEKRIGGKMERVAKFKWTRAIWANALLETVFKDIQKGKEESDESSEQRLFLQQMLGHTNTDIQNHYLYIEIDMGEEKKVKGSHAYTNKKGESIRAKKLIALADNNAIAGRSAFRKINDFLIEKLNETPKQVVTQSYIARELGSARPIIKEYLAFVSAELGDIFGNEKRTK